MYLGPCTQVRDILEAIGIQTGSVLFVPVILGVKQMMEDLSFSVSPCLYKSVFQIVNKSLG